MTTLSPENSLSARLSASFILVRVLHQPKSLPPQPLFCIRSFSLLGGKDWDPELAWMREQDGLYLGPAFRANRKDETEVPFHTSL